MLRNGNGENSVCNRETDPWDKCMTMLSPRELRCRNASVRKRSGGRLGSERSASRLLDHLGAMVSCT